MPEYDMFDCVTNSLTRFHLILPLDTCTHVCCYDL